MKNIIIAALIASAMISTTCGQSEKKSNTVALHDPPVEEVAVEQDQGAIHKTAIAQFVDPSRTEEVNFLEVFQPLILIDDQLQQAELPQALELYQQLIDQQSQNGGLPLFEVKNTSQVVLTVAGKGVLAHVLADKKLLTIEKVEFLKESKTRGLGPGTERLQDQLKGKAITFNPNNFGLKPWDMPKFEGDVQLEGISGATDVCQSVVDVLNQQLPNYRAYFEREDS